MKLTHGCTRTVLLLGRWAVKVPTCLAWRLFIRGLIANMDERLWWKTRDPRLCPVLFSLPGGWLLVMRRADRICTDEDSIDYRAFAGLPMDPHPDNIGVIEGQLVLVDYGSFSKSEVDAWPWPTAEARVAA